MIGKLTGILAEFTDITALIDTPSGVSYELFITPHALSGKGIGDSIAVLTHLQVREDAQVLFGFANAEEKTFFHLLLSVPGVGPKTAFAIVSQVTFESAVQAVRKNEVSLFSKVSGVGKKTALKIVLELSQKFKSEFVFEQQLTADDKTVIDALIELGYKKHDAQTIFAKLPKDLSIEEKIQEALRITVKK